MASVLDPVLRYAEVAPDNIAIRGIEHHWTYQQLRDASLAFADRVREAGLGIDDRVLLAAPSVAEFIVATWGFKQLGALWCR